MRTYIWGPLLLAGCVTGATGALAQEEADTSGDIAAISDIVVTAERRESTVQKSSLSIQVLSPEELENVSRPTDLTAVAPGIQLGATGVNSQVFIRGVGDNAGNTRDSSAVNFIVDGIVYSHSPAAISAFYDLERVEVLKGPQGTLYGRNSSGGAINIITKRPQLGEISGYLTGEVGSFDLVSGEGAINLPLGDKVAIRLAGQIVDRDGYLSAGGQDQRSQAGRLRVLVEPSDSVSLLISGDVSHVGGNGAGAVLLPVHNGDPWRQITDLPSPVAPFGGIFPNPASSPFLAPDDGDLDQHVAGVSAELNVDIGDFATLTVLPGYRYQKQKTVSYTLNQRVAEDAESKQWSLEGRLSHDGERLKWVVGGFWFRDDIVQYFYVPTLTAQLYDLYVKSLAGFGQASFEVVDNVRVIGGLRYSRETTGATFFNGTGAYPRLPFVQTTGPFTISPPVVTKKTNWKVGLEADIGPSSMAYATASNGFKAGGFVPKNCEAETQPFFGPEIVTAYSGGLRNRFFNNRLQVNVEAFLWKYKGQQVAVQSPADACGGALGRYTFNVGDSTIKGANIDLTWRATSADTLRIFVEYANGRYDDFEFTLGAPGRYAPAFGTLCDVTTLTGPTRTAIDCSGLPSIRLPKWTAQFDYSHDFELGNGGRITPKINVQVAGPRWLNVDYVPNARAPGYTLVNGEIGYTAPENKWSLTAYVRNLTNEEVYTAGGSIVSAVSGTPSPLTPDGNLYYSAQINTPRAYGVRARINF